MAEPDLGWTDLGVRPDASGFGTALDRQLGTQMTGAGRSAASRFSAGFKRAATVGIAGGGLLALKIGKDSIDQASDLNESLNAVNVTYGKQAEAVRKLGEESAESLGLSNSEFNGLAVQFSAFATEVAGGAGPKVSGVLDDLTTRAADFASVMNLDVADAAGLFQSGLAGETEPLRKYGIDLSAAAVEAHALATGIADSSGELTEAEKVQARYSLLMESTSKVQGDFANTSDSLANQQRILTARWDDAQARLGTALLPILEDVTGFLVDEGVPAFERFATWFTEDGVPAIKGFVDEVKPAVGVVKDLVGFLADLPSEAKVAGLVALAGGVGAAKLTGGGSGALGAAGRVLGTVKPVPVFVTNPGLGGVGGGGLGGNTTKLAAATGTLAATVGKFARLVPFIPVGLGSERDDPRFDENRVRIGLPARSSTASEIAAIESQGRAFLQAEENAAKLREGIEKLPETLQSRFELLGVPETERELRHILSVYDIAAKDRRTTLELLGFDPLLDRIARINRELDWAARPREARISITKAYDAAGYETRGGLQEGGGGPVRQRSRAGGGI